MATGLVLMDKLITNCLLNRMGIRMAIFKSWYFVVDLEIEEMEYNYFVSSFLRWPLKLRCWNKVLGISKGICWF